MVAQVINGKLSQQFLLHFLFGMGAIHKRRRNILGGGSSEILMLQEIKR